MILVFILFSFLPLFWSFFDASSCELISGRSLRLCVKSGARLREKVMGQRSSSGSRQRLRDSERSSALLR
jgi:hypothetical protein